MWESTHCCGLLNARVLFIIVIAFLAEIRYWYILKCQNSKIQIRAILLMPNCFFDFRVIVWSLDSRLAVEPKTAPLLQSNQLP